LEELENYFAEELRGKVSSVSPHHPTALEKLLAKGKNSQ
jgi:hypothetical protein